MGRQKIFPNVDTGSLTIQLPVSLITQVKIAAIHRRCEVSELAAEALTAFCGAGAGDHVAHLVAQKASRQVATRSHQAPLATTAEGTAIDASALLEHLSGVVGTALSQSAFVEAMEAATGKEWGRDKGACYRGWLQTLKKGKLPKDAEGMLKALEEVGHPFAHPSTVNPTSGN